MRFCILTMALVLAACAAPPDDGVDVQSLADKDLCAAYKQRGAYEGDAYAVRREIARRRLDCAGPGSLRREENSLAPLVRPVFP